MKTLTRFAALTLLAASTLAFGDTPTHAVLGPPPTPVDQKKAKVKYLNTDPECKATVTATSSAPGVASIQKGATSKPSVLSHTIKLTLVEPGTTTITVSIDFDDPDKSDVEETVDVVVLPSAKAAEKTLKQAGGAFLKSVKASANQAVKDFKAVKIGLDDDADEQDALDAVGDVMDACLQKEGDLQDDFDDAAGEFEDDMDGALASGGHALPFLPKAALLGTCELFDMFSHGLDSTLTKAFGGLGSEARKKLDALAKGTLKAPVKLKSNMVSVARTPPELVLGPDPKPPVPDHPPTLSVTATLLQPDGGEPYARIHASTLLPDGNTSATFSLWDDLGAVLQAVGAGTPLDTHGNALRTQFVLDLPPGRTYTVEVSDPTSGLTTRVRITTPSV